MKKKRKVSKKAMSAYRVVLIFDPAELAKNPGRCHVLELNDWPKK